MTNPIDKLAALARRDHSDGCLSLPKWSLGLLTEGADYCSCTADDHNAKLDAVLAEIGEVKIRHGRSKPERHRRIDGDRTYLLAEIREPVSKPDGLEGEG